jgi:hypothetical protein
MSKPRNHRRTKGNSFLTHGGDDHAHRAHNKGRRAEDQAEIDDQLAETDDVEFQGTPVNINTTFRLVLTTQYCEWYGNEDGQGRWKYKGGCEYHAKTDLTIQMVLNLGSDGLARMAERVAASICRSCPDNPSPHEGYEYLIAWDLYASDEPTHEERELAEMHEWGWLTDDEYQRRIADLSHTNWD